MKRTVSLIIALIMILCLVSCSDSSPAALTLEEHEISEAKYSYWASSHKGNYMYTYEDIENTAAYWQSELTEGVTVAEYFDSLTLDSVKATLINCVLFDKYGLSFTESELDSVDAYISDLIKERADGSKNQMNTVLGEYGINLNILRDIYLDEEKAAKVFEYLFSDDGEMALSEKDYEKFYNENYVRVQMIYIENISTYATDDDGNRITGDDGYYVIEKLEGEEKVKKDQAVKAVQDGLANGESFDELYEKYSELKDYTGGQYYSATENYSDVFYYKLVSEVEKLNVGDTVTLESEMGTCIIKKLELDEGGWKKDENKDFFGKSGENFISKVQEESYRKLIESYFDKVSVDDEIIKKYSVVDVTPAYFF